VAPQATAAIDIWQHCGSDMSSLVRDAHDTPMTRRHRRRYLAAVTTSQTASGSCCLPDVVCCYLLSASYRLRLLLPVCKISSAQCCRSVASAKCRLLPDVRAVCCEMSSAARCTQMSSTGRCRLHLPYVTCCRMLSAMAVSQCFPTSCVTFICFSITNDVWPLQPTSIPFPLPPTRGHAGGASESSTSSRPPNPLRLVY
jgi:hypothetical protein